MRFSPIATAALAGLMLSGCATVETAREVNAAYGANERTAENLRGTMPTSAPRNEETVRVLDTPYVDTTPISGSQKGASTLNCEITFTASSTSLLAFAQQVGRDCGVPVRVTPDAIEHVNGERKGAAAGPIVAGGGAASMPSAATLPLPPLDGLTEALSAVREDTISLPPPGYVGQVSGLLDAITSRYGLSWSHSERGISIHYLQTRRYSIDAFPTETSFASSFDTGTQASTGATGGTGGGGSGGGGSSGGGLQGSIGSQQSTNISMTNELYADIEESIKAMLSPAGKVAMNRTSGAVIVTDAPEVQDAIEEYLRSENAALSQQITFHVKIYQVATGNDARAGIDWTVVYNTLSSNYGIRANTGSLGDAMNLGTLGVGVLQTATGSAARWRGSNILFDALSTAGKVSTIRSPSVITQNMRTAPIQTAKQIGYIPSVTTTAAPNAGTQTGSQVSFITVGFSMALTPRVLANGDIMVQMSATISALNDLRTRVVGNATIDVPEIELRKFDATANLRSGETLVLHGFEQADDRGSQSGSVSPFAWLLGGNTRQETSRSQLVVAITPVLN